MNDQTEFLARQPQISGSTTTNNIPLCRFLIAFPFCRFLYCLAPNLALCQLPTSSLWGEPCMLKVGCGICTLSRHWDLLRYKVHSPTDLKTLLTTRFAFITSKSMQSKEIHSEMKQDFATNLQTFTVCSLRFSCQKLHLRFTRLNHNWSNNCSNQAARPARFHYGAVHAKTMVVIKASCTAVPPGF